MTWIPLVFKGGLIGGIGWTMALFGGYYPILVYIMPLILLLQPLSFVIGCFMASSQLLPFWGYFKKSIRNGVKIDRDFGRVPLWKFISLVIPFRSYKIINGVHYPEMEMYMGIAPLLIWNSSWKLVFLGISLLFCLGIFPSLQRIGARSLYSLSFLIAIITVQEPLGLHFLILHGFLLLYNSSIYPSFPFSQWWDQPSRLYLKKQKADGWPFNTGYLLNRKVSVYAGSFRLSNA